MRKDTQIRGRFQEGFSLIEVVIALAVFSFFVALIISQQSLVIKQVVSMDHKVGLLRFQNQVEMALDNKCALGATYYNPNNQRSLSCLHNDTSCKNLSSTALEYLDEEGQILVGSGSAPLHFDHEGKPCSPGGSSCQYQAELHWQPLCQGTSCINPAVQLEFKMFRIEGPSGSTAYTQRSQVLQLNKVKPSLRIRRGCQEYFDAGASESGLFLIDPDGEGSSCPFEAYCRFDTITGDAWVLVVNAPDSGYTEVPVVDRLVPAKRGRLKDEEIQTLLQAIGSHSSTKNNISVFVEAGQTFLSMHPSMHFNGSVSSSGRVFANDNDCSIVQETPVVSAQFQPGSHWEFGSGITGLQIGYSEAPRRSLSGFAGFVCDGCSAGATPSPTPTPISCGIDTGSCCAARQPGEVWFRW